MSNFLDELKKYFESTPQNKILEDWAKSERYDEIGPTVEEFIRNSQLYYVCSEAPDDRCLQVIVNDLSPKYSSGFFLIPNPSSHAKCSIFNN
jgi:hypothetical protein